MPKKTSDIIKSIHKNAKSVSDSVPVRLAQPLVVSGASVVQTRAIERIACSVADMAAGTGGVPTSRSLIGVDSIQGGGDLTADRTFSLVNDDLNPGADQYYGTDVTGTKGFYPVPGAGTGTDLSIVNRNVTTLDIASSTGIDATVPQATTLLAGLMTASDKVKLDGIAAGAEVNVQSDWNEVNPASDAFILNKPTIGASGIIYSLADGTPVVVTVGDRGLASTGVGADKTYETSQTIDPLTGDTINQNFANGTVNFDNSTINNTDSTINNVNTVTNNDATSDINNNGNTITNTSTTTDNIDVVENYDSTSVTNNNGNTTNNTDTTENYLGDNIVNLADGATITNNLDGDVNNNYGDTYTENNVYQDGATINNTGDVINNYTNYDETNNYTNSEVTTNGGTFNYNNVTEVYDANSNITYEGDIYIGGDIINTFNDTNNGTVAVEVGPGVSWTNIANALDCDGVNAVSSPIDPALLDNVSLVVADVITGDINSNAVTIGAPAIYGTASDMRGLALTPAIVNAVDFGAAFKFGDSAYIKVTGFGFAIPALNTILGAKVNVTFTTTPTSVSVDCITITIYHTDGSTIASNLISADVGNDIVLGTDNLLFVPAPLTRIEEVPTGLVNSANVTYTTTQTVAAGSSFVYLNGLAQKYTTDYSIAGTTITFVTAPSTGATLFVKYMY